MSDDVRAVSERVKKFDRLISFVEHILMVLSSISLVLMLLVIIWSLIARQMGLPTIWTNELASYLMIYVTFLAAPWILARDQHVRVDLLINAVRGKKLRVINIFIAIVSTIAIACFFWYSASITIENFQNGTQLVSTVQWPQYILLLPIPIGTFFLLIRFLLNIFQSNPAEN